MLKQMLGAFFIFAGLVAIAEVLLVIVTVSAWSMQTP